MPTDNVEQLNRLAWREGKSLKHFRFFYRFRSVVVIVFLKYFYLKKYLKNIFLIFFISTLQNNLKHPKHINLKQIKKLRFFKFFQKHF